MELLRWAGVPTPWLAAITLGLMALGPLLWMLELGAGWRDARRLAALRRTGMPAVARVLAVTDTWDRLSRDRHVLRLALRIEGPDGFDTTLDVPVAPARVHDFGRACVLRVRLDPRTRALAIDQRTE